MQIFTDWAKQFSQLLNLPENFQSIAQSPLSIATLIGCVVLLIVLVKARKIKFTLDMFEICCYTIPCKVKCHPKKYEMRYQDE